MEYTRSTFLAGVSALLAAPAAAATGVSPLAAIDPGGPPRSSPEAALRFLCAGNAGFRAGGTRRIPRPSWTTHQRPYATLLTCADTRVAPEIVFNTGFDDLFVCRTAGNITNDIVTGSIEYSVYKFHAPLVAVVAHRDCGACVAAIDAYDGRGWPGGSIDAVVKAIIPAVHAVGRVADPIVRLRLVAKKNAELTAKALTESKILKKAIDAKLLWVKAAYYDLENGMVTFDGGCPTLR